MDADFWHYKWQHNEIGFHEGQANSLLVNHIDRLALPIGSRVFLPLCGKTRDIAWLLSKGYRVAGAELSPLAVEQLFNELEIQPEVTSSAPLSHFHADKLDIFVGNIFELSRVQLGPVDAVYDRAALVALPEDVRPRYAAHLLEISANAPQLLICFEYEQTRLAGPPFAISDAEVHRHYGHSHQLSLLASVPVPGGLKNKCPANEKLWLLTPH